MSVNYSRPTIFNNIYEPTFNNPIPVYYGPSLPAGSSSYRLKNINLRKYIFKYNADAKFFILDNILQGLRFKSINSVIDVNDLQDANDALFDQKKFSGDSNNILAILNNKTNIYSSNIVDLIFKINIVLNTIINSPKNNEFYFVEGFVKKWINNRLQGEVSSGAKSNTYVYNIYRYGVCLLNSNSSNDYNFLYKIIKSIDSNVDIESSLKNI